MKKWQKILIGAVTAAAVLAAGAAIIFKTVVVPKYIEPILETAALVLNDDDVKKDIAALAEEYAKKGLIDKNLVEKYMSENNIGSENTQKNSETEKTDTQAAESGVNGVGGKTVKTGETEGKKYTYGKKEKHLPEQATASGTEKVSDSERSIYERAMSEVEPSDRARAYELASKLDMGKVRSLISDRAALKEYIASALTEEEYSEAVSLYLKYSYLLK